MSLYTILFVPHVLLCIVLYYSLHCYFLWKMSKNLLLHILLLIQELTILLKLSGRQVRYDRFNLSYIFKNAFYGQVSVFRKENKLMVTFLQANNSH